MKTVVACDRSAVVFLFLCLAFWHCKNLWVRESDSSMYLVSFWSKLTLQLGKQELTPNT